MTYLFFSSVRLVHRIAPHAQRDLAVDERNKLKFLGPMSFI
jgi:hypothetical protein